MYREWKLIRLRGSVRDTCIYTVPLTSIQGRQMGMGEIDRQKSGQSCVCTNGRSSCSSLRSLLRNRACSLHRTKDISMPWVVSLNVGLGVVYLHTEVVSGWGTENVYISTTSWVSCWYIESVDEVIIWVTEWSMDTPGPTVKLAVLKSITTGSLPPFYKTSGLLRPAPHHNYIERYLPKHNQLRYNEVNH